MLNSTPLNSWPLNALAGGAKPDDPDVIDPPAPPDPPLAGDGVYPGFPVPPPPSGHSFRWSAVVLLGGADVSELLTGSISVDREEGAAGIAEFCLFYMPGEPVQTDLADRTVTIDYITDDGLDALQVRLFTGLVAEPRWDATARTMRITATDNLQQRVEAMTITDIDTLAGGAWSPDLFDLTDGRSRWDYAQERMSSRAASLDCSSDGKLRVTPWQAAPPRYIFGDDTTAYQSIRIDLAQLRNVTNRVEIEVSYRYTRMREARAQFSWTHPRGDFCNWRQMSTELPTRDMVFSATTGASLVPIIGSWTALPPTHPDPCGTGAPWINNHSDLILGAQWTGARRWAQSVTEKYNLTLTTEAGEVTGQQVITRTGFNVIVDADDADTWAKSLVSIDPAAEKPAPSPALPAGDRTDEVRRTAALNCALQVARTEILAAHRQTLVSWAVPTSMALGVDLTHTIEISDQGATARAKCSHRTDELNFETGSAITSLTISVMRGGGESDVLAVPARIGAGGDTGGGAGWDGVKTLPSQFGGRFVSPIYDDMLDGFSGNYDARQDSTLEIFPRRLALTAPAIDESKTDELELGAAVVYSVGIPNDLLEL